MKMFQAQWKNSLFSISPLLSAWVRAATTSRKGPRIRPSHASFRKIFYLEFRNSSKWGGDISKTACPIMIILLFYHYVAHVYVTIFLARHSPFRKYYAFISTNSTRYCGPFLKMLNSFGCFYALPYTVLTNNSKQGSSLKMLVMTMWTKRFAFLPHHCYLTVDTFPETWVMFFRWRSHKRSLLHFSLCCRDKRKKAFHGRLGPKLSLMFGGETWARQKQETGTTTIHYTWLLLWSWMGPRVIWMNQLSSPKKTCVTIFYTEGLNSCLKPPSAVAENYLCWK